MEKIKAIFCWSGGKDSAMALYTILQENKYEVKYLLTTINGQNHRIAMHGVKEALLDAQAQAIGIPQLKVYTYEATNDAYEKAMEQTLLQAKTEGIHHVIFGDIFLEDLRIYRENNLAKVQMQAVFPLWKQDTTYLVNKFIDTGFKTITCCINDASLTAQHVGRLITRDFISQLPAGVDPCGENGEFHTFCFDGPLFKQAIPIEAEQKIYMPLTLPVNTDTDVCNTEIKTKGFWYNELTLIDQSNTQYKKCPHCFTYFKCRVDDISQCQCSTVKLNANQLNHIANKYTDCLCANCMQLLAAEVN
ncbi:MAG: diphthine--ammonia ligase [Bacteroidota bacterium]